MKKLICLAAIITFVVNAFSLPSWYSEQVVNSEQIIFRENGGFIDTIYTACASAKLGEEIKSLDNAKDRAIEEAFSKIEEKICSTAEGEKKLLHCFYDTNKDSAAAYVQVSLTLSDTYLEEPPVPKTQMDLLREYSSNLDVPLKLENAKLTITGCVKTNLLNKNGLFGIGLSEKTKNILKSKTQVTYKYPNGVPVKDDVATYSDSEFAFKFKNCIKSRRTFVIIRVDNMSECDDVLLVFKNIEAKEKIRHNSNERWQNLVFEFDEGFIDEYSPEFILKIDGKSITLGSFFVYQEL